MPDHAAADARERALLSAVEGGLPLVSHPFEEIAVRVGASEAWVLETLARLMDEGVIKRLGVVVRHRELGYRANAMVVWDVPDEEVSEIGRRFGDVPFVTLCYRRPRHMPDWRYNLFTMIHGRDRDHVLEQIGSLCALVPERALQHEVLFSTRCFKQRGARYAAPGAGVHVPGCPGSVGETH